MPRPGRRMAAMRFLAVLSILGLVGCDARDPGDAGASRDAAALDGGSASRDGGQLDGGILEAGAVDGGGPDAGEDSGVADSGLADSGLPDSGLPDSGLPDSGLPDSGVDAGPPPRADHHIHIHVSNTCVMRVDPIEITVPAGQTAYFDWHNHSRDYPVDVWMSYGGGFLDLRPGMTWDEPIGHCGTPRPHTEWADIDTACSGHRFLIHCL